MTDPSDFGRGLQLSLALLQWDGDDLERETSEARVCLARMDWSTLTDAQARRLWAIVQGMIKQNLEATQ